MFRKHLFVRRLVALTLLAGLIALAGPTPAAAQEEITGTSFTVTVFTDDNTRNGNCTLREAIQAANVNRRVDACPAGSNTSADTIQLAAGTYVISVAGARENGNFTGDFDIAQSVNILGAGIDATIIDAQTLDRAFNNRSSTATLRIKDLTIQNGMTGQDDRPDNGGAVSGQGVMLFTRVRFLNNKVTSITDEMGGAIYNAGRLELTDSEFIDNLSEREGGAIANIRSAKLWGVTFSGNSAAGGGAILTAGSGASLEIRGSRFTENDCQTGYAAAILQRAGSTTLVEDTIFENHAQCLAQIINNAGTMDIRLSTFTGNNVSSDGVINNENGTLNISDSTFSANVEALDGTTINIQNGRVSIERITLSGNQGANLRLRGGWARVGNSTFTGATQTGGECQAGVCVQAGQLFLESVTLAGNVSDGGGALAVTGGTVTLHNTLLANSANLAGAPVADCQSAPGTLKTRGYNLVSRADGCGWTAATGDQLGTLAAPVDPLLDTLKDNGGPTQTHALLAGSPAIDKADTVIIFRVDQRLYKRPAGPRIDIGAFEANAVP